MKFYTACMLRGKNILVRGYNNGRRFQENVPFKPILYRTTETPSPFKTLNGKSLKAIQFSNAYECREFVKRYKDDPDGSVFGNSDFITQYLLTAYPNEVTYDLSKINIAYLDIECESENGFSEIDTPTEKINLITVKVAGMTYVLTQKQVVLPGCNVVLCASEKDMISKFFGILKKTDVDVLTGWNVKLFDIPYIMGRAKIFFEEDELQSWTPFNMIKCQVRNIGDKDYTMYEIPGYTILDYLDLYKKFSGKLQSSYKLDHIAEVELKLKKVSYEEYDSLREFYTKNFQKFAEYNVQDVDLVERLDGQLKLINLALSICYEAKITYDKVFFPTHIWETICCDYLLRKDVISPLKTSYDKEDKFKGAYVKEIRPGRYKNIVSLDATSLYPSIIQSWGISPETLDSHRYPIGVNDFLKEESQDLKMILHTAALENKAVACNGCMFDRNQMGFIPTLIERTLSQRKEAKSKMLELEKEYEKTKDDSLLPTIQALKIRQEVKKVLANSLYGCMGNPTFTFSSPELATAVTLTGQVIIQITEREINGYINRFLKNDKPKDYIIAMDTDSVYLNMEEIISVIKSQTNVPDVTKLTRDIVEQKIQVYLNKQLDTLTSKLNCHKSKISFKLEFIASDGFWVAKKNYALWVNEKEGVRFAKGKSIIKGLASKRSSTPPLMQEHLEACTKLILLSTEAELKGYVDKLKKDYTNLPIKDISSASSVSGLSNYSDPFTIFKKGTPIATKASLLHNAYVRKLNLEKEIPMINEIDKIKFVIVKIPNPYGCSGEDSVMGYVGRPPKEFHLEKYVDRTKQFDKIFMKPLQIMLDAVGWSLNTKPSLDSYFA